MCIYIYTHTERERERDVHASVVFRCSTISLRFFNIPTTSTRLTCAANWARCVAYDCRLFALIDRYLEDWARKCVCVICAQVIYHVFLPPSNRGMKGPDRFYHRSTNQSTVPCFD